MSRSLLACLLYTGMRQGELLGLRWQDVDFERGLLRLRLQLQRPGKGRAAALAPLKMDSQRDVVLLPQLAGLLREQRAQCPHSSDEDFVFSRGDGAPLHYSQMNRLLRKMAKAAGVEKVSAHVFRRTFASHLIIEQGLDVVRVQRQLGHSRPSVTSDRYSFLFEQARHADELRQGMAASAYAAPLGLAEPHALAES
jgi:integrase